MRDPAGYGFGRDGIDAVLEAADEPLLSDAEWDLVGRLFPELNGEDDYAFAGETIVDVRRSQSGSKRGHKAAPREMQPVEMPEHWRLQCEQLFRAYSEDAAVARLILAVEAPLPAEGLGDYLEQVATRERDEGDPGYIAYVDERGRVRQVRLRRGYRQQDFREAVKRGETTRLPAMRPKGMTEREWQANPRAVPGRSLAIDWIAPRTNRLCRIADLANKVAKKTGCHEAEATMFLLCDIVPQLPWLEAVVHKFDSGRRHAFTIYVGSPLVPAEDVRRFYIQLRERASQPTTWGQTKRGRSPWTYELLTFVEERRRKWWYWKGIFEVWNEQFPDHPYKSVPAMQRSFYQARGKRPEEPAMTVIVNPPVFRPEDLP